MILDSLSLDGKVAIITGASQGLGHAMALKFAESGADIVAASRTKEKLEQTAEEVKKLGRKCLVVPADVTQSAQVNAIAAAAVKEFGRIDVLVNNAGGGDEMLGARLEDITDEIWRNGIDTNLSSQFYGCRAVIPQMLKQNRGKIINVASGYGLRGGKHNYMYACSKGGMIQLTRSMALEYAPMKVRVNAIAPSATLTERVKKLISQNPALKKLAASHLLVNESAYENHAQFLLGIDGVDAMA